MSMFLFNLLLALTWAMATGQFTVPNLVFGFGLGYLLLRSVQRIVGPSPYFAKVPLALRFALLYVWELILANIRLAYDVLVPGAWSRTGAVRMTPIAPHSHPAVSGWRTGPPSNGSVRAPLASPSYITPGVIAIPLDVRTDAEITLLANLITLTPGSVSLDLSADRRTLYVHAMYIDGGDVEAYRRSVKEGLERRVLELLR
ncbi:MAG: Na+/H+ antiporter subunit E [Planctomycetaceae bacterium]|nr:Na+/H+ antiporter subunit E [Planctomycetaceae bacterium]